MSRSLLHIHHWHSDYWVARDDPDPERARAALDRVCERLPDELASGLDRWFDADGDDVVLLRRLEFECEVDVSQATEALAARWAGRFARALSGALDSGEGVMRFPTAAAYRARFIADLAAGHAWHTWYYHPFAGLRALPPAAAIRSVLLEEPHLGHETLLALPDAVWPALSAAMTRREAARIIDGLTLAGGPAPDPGQLQSLLAPAWNLLQPGGSAAVHALAILRQALHAGLAPTRWVGAWARLAAGLAAALAGGGAAARQAVACGDLAALATDARGEAEWVSLLATHPHWREPLAAAATETAAPASRRSGPACTEFAGLALLLPELDELLDAALCDTLPPAVGSAPRNLAAWLALAHCAGHLRAARFADESFWREFFALSPGFALAQAAAWLIAADAGPALSRLAEGAAGRARGAPVPVRLPIGGQRLGLQVDHATGIWQQWTDGAATSLAAARGRGGAVSHWSAALAAARRARADWRFLSIGLGLPAQWERFFVQLAQVVLRRFAYRIPGFARSSLPYVYANFLAAEGRCDDAGRLCLTRPPLHTLLNFTGMSRTVLHWSGPPARVLAQDYAP